MDVHNFFYFFDYDYFNFIFFFFQHEYKVAAGILVVAAQTWQGLYVTKYLKILYSTHNAFNKLATIQLITGVTSFTSVYFVYLYGFYGLCIRAIIIVLVDYFFTTLWKPINVVMKWDRNSFINLIKIGTPMFLVTNIYGKMPLLQRSLIVILGGTKALGLFSLAFMVENSFKIFSDSIASVTYPNMTIAWGRNNTVGKIIKSNLLKPMKIIIPGSLIIVIAGFYLMPLVIKSFFPKYAEVILASQIMLIVGFIGLFFVLGNIYNVVNNQKERLKMYITGIFTWSIFLIILYQLNGFSLEMFPTALIVSYIIMITINIYFIRKNWYKNKNSYY